MTSKKIEDTFDNIHVVKALGRHDLIILQFRWATHGYILHQINQTASKSG